MAKRDLYEILGVARTAGEDDIKKSYRKLAMKYHPDRNPDDKTAEDKFKEAKEAYEILSDAGKRKLYDRGGHAALEQQGAPGAGNRGGSPFDMKDIFKAFDDDGSDPFQRGSAKPVRGADVKTALEMSLEEAFNGGRHTVHYTSAGQKNSLTMDLPPGISDGKTLALKDRGEPGKSGGAKGNLVIQINVKPHDVFRRDGNDLVCRVSIPVTTAALGGEINVPTLTKTFNALAVPAGTQSGQKLRLTGKGMPVLEKKGTFGDMLVEVQVETPTNLSTEQTLLLRKLAETLRAPRP